MGSFIRTFLSIALLCILLVGVGCSKNKENVSEIVKEDKDNVVSVQITNWQSEGFDGIVVNGNGQLIKGESVKVIFNENTLVFKSNGAQFKYNDEEPNAEDCGINIDETVEITYRSYEPAIDNLVCRIYSDKITY